MTALVRTFEFLGRRDANGAIDPHLERALREGGVTDIRQAAGEGEHVTADSVNYHRGTMAPGKSVDNVRGTLDYAKKQGIIRDHWTPAAR